LENVKKLGDYALYNYKADYHIIANDYFTQMPLLMVGLTWFNIFTLLCVCKVISANALNKIILNELKNE
jgi:hypothetical protein